MSHTDQYFPEMVVTDLVQTPDIPLSQKPDFDGKMVLQTDYSQLERDHQERLSRAIASTPAFKEWRKKRFPKLLDTQI